MIILATIASFLACGVSSSAIPAAPMNAASLPRIDAVVNFSDLPWANKTDDFIPLEKRTVGGIFLCTDAGWQGTCGYKVQPLNTCINLDPPWSNDLSCVGPDPGTAVITYLGRGCSSDCTGTVGCGWTFTYPGSSDLSRDSPMNDRVGSLLAIAT